MYSYMMPLLKQTRMQRRPTGLVRRFCALTYVGRRRVATGAAAVLAVGLGYHVIFGHNGLTAYEQKRRDSVMLNEELNVLQRENNLMKWHVERLQNDPGAIEHQAREELHYTRAGEVIYTLPAAPYQEKVISSAPVKN